MPTGSSLCPRYYLVWEQGEYHRTLPFEQHGGALTGEGVRLGGASLATFYGYMSSVSRQKAELLGG